MAAAIGTVKSISGVVKAITPDGEERILKLGDTVYEGEQIVTLDDGIVMLELFNGLLVDLARGEARPDATRSSPILRGWIAPVK